MKKVNPIRCAALKDLVEDEERMGTYGAARKNSVTFGTQRKLSLDNRVRGFGGDSPDGAGGRIDQDWWMDLVVANGQAPNAFFGNLASPRIISSYSLGKLLWVAKARSQGLAQTYSMPFSDPGESAAVDNLINGRRFRDVFTRNWFDRFCK